MNRRVRVLYAEADARFSAHVASSLGQVGTNLPDGGLCGRGDAGDPTASTRAGWPFQARPTKRWAGMRWAVIPGLGIAGARQVEGVLRAPS